MERRAKMQLEELPLDKIDIGEGNVRQRKLDVGLAELAASMKRIGLLHPIVVFEKNGRWELIIGQRRFLAAMELGWETIPAIIRKPLDSMQAKIFSLSENLHRRPLVPRDMSDVCRHLYLQRGSVKAVADELGVSIPTVSKYLSVALLPESIKKFVDDGEITAADAIKLWDAARGDERLAVGVAQQIVQRRMTRDEKQRVFDTLWEANPGDPIEGIIRKAHKRKYMEIVLHLPEKYAEGMERASQDMDREPATIVMNLITEWLHEHGYA